MKRYVSWKTAALAKDKGFADWDACEMGINPRDGSPLIGVWPVMRKAYQDGMIDEVLGRPELWILQDWLEELSIMIDIFYEDGLWSGRVFELGDEKQRWQSCSTPERHETLEAMIVSGLNFLK